MKINRLMQVVFVSGAVAVTVPAFAASLPATQAPSALCGDDTEDEDDEKDEDEKEVETLCGGSSDSDEDEDDDKKDEDGEETSRL